MMKINYKFILPTALMGLLLSQFANAGWMLNNDASKLNFISIKNEHISESHSFTMLSGKLSKDGKLSVKVDLESVSTNIPIRDERMQEHVFDLDNFPFAELTASVDKKLLSLSSGSSVTQVIQSKVSISGVTQSVSIEVSVARNSDGGFTATTVKPFMLQVTSFKLTQGIAKLQELAGLNSISLAVPVTFSVKFEQE